jgi:hypothetical protein
MVSYYYSFSLSPTPPLKEAMGESKQLGFGFCWWPVMPKGKSLP